MGAKKATIKSGTRPKPPELVATGAGKAGTSISVRALRKDWRRVRAMVARGEKIVVTDNGLPIMQLVPVEQPVVAKFDWMAHLEEIREITAGKTTGENAVLEERSSHKW